MVKEPVSIASDKACDLCHCDGLARYYAAEWNRCREGELFWKPARAV